MVRNTLSLGLAVLALLLGDRTTAAELPAPKRTSDVIYGRRDGLALTLDVFQPPGKANGAAIIMVVSGNFDSSPEHIDRSFVAAAEILKRGYTVFAVVHGSSPRYTLLEIREDVNRSVRFVRHNHKRFGIDPDRIGVAGASSGGLVALLVGVAPLPANPQANDPVDRVDSRVQALACFFPGTDYLNYGARGKELLEMKDYRIDHRAAHDFRIWDPRERLFERVTNRDERRKLLRDLSPIYHITAQSPPTLLVHGDQDELVPLQQSESFVARLKEAGVPAKLAKKEGKGHDWRTIVSGTGEVADWFDEHLPQKEERKGLPEPRM